MTALGKRTTKIREGVDREKLYPLAEAVKMVKERAKAKFDETIEVAMNLGIDPRHADQMVRGVVNLPNGSGRSVRVAVFARGVKADEAKAAGADVVGAEDLVEKVQGGAIDFDRVVATPDLMPLVGRLGKVLGPRGLMPNPKVGTVTMDITNAVKGAKGGSVEFRAEKAGIVQAGIGKASFSEDKLIENIKAFADAVQKSRPGGAKGHFINRVAISSTMGPGVKVEPGSLFAGSEQTHLNKAWQNRQKPLDKSRGRAGPVCRRAFLRFTKTTLARPLLASILYGFSKRRRSLAAVVNVSCPRLQAPATA